MPTTIQVDEGTREAILRYAFRLQAKLGRKVTFDEAIRSLIEETSTTEEARRKWDDLFGSLAAEEGVWRELEAERKKDAKRLERKAANP